MELAQDTSSLIAEDSDSPVVLVIDDDPSVRSSLNRLLRGAGYHVKAFASPSRVFDAGRPRGPCCLILDVELPKVNGLAFHQSLERAGVRVPTIFITGYGSIPMGVDAMKAGAADFLPKPFDVDHLVRAVRRALDEDARLLAEEREMAILRRRYENLTLREREVFFAVTGGLLNKQAASQLGITEKTIKVHRGHVTEKMEAESFAALVRMADLLAVELGRTGGSAEDHPEEDELEECDHAAS